MGVFLAAHVPILKIFLKAMLPALSEGKCVAADAIRRNEE